MLVLKGSEAAARIKKEVQEMVEGLGGHVPTAAIVRVGERPDDGSQTFLYSGGSCLGGLSGGFPGSGSRGGRSSCI